MDGRTIPTLIELIPSEEPENRTLVRIVTIQFNKPVDESFFSQQNMKRIR